MSKDNKRSTQSGAARLLGSATSAIFELGVFHPVDTISKRLMTNQTRVASLSQFNQVIFRKHAAEPFGKRFFTLFPGLNFAFSYKILQRVLKFGGQPYVNDFLNQNFMKSYDSLFGSKTGKAMRSATAGSVMGLFEVILLPLDVLKIKSQTNPEAFKGRGVLRILKDEGITSLYRGWGWTMARNAPGSFALFGGNAFAKEYILKLENYDKATWGQNFISSIFGASASLIVSAPLDVIKTRIQNRSFDNPESGVTIVKNTIKNEGITAFFKGLIPKLLTTGPKLVFSFALAQTFIPMYDNLFKKA
ncbi:probable Mitochondrial GTP/GDP carrier protein 1 [Saccharomycodes ludwigii]|uniref:Probable Mitochondrial GTP/GDP carrier protein 1 n=1 Tax=Saccharomycodes ludwigii TaxID=36035 RepID=A0A376B7E9_9ASCO|nr:hypothetical protein SCDLUD_001916 [Saccharomycodes ludwigii]KAH3902103.1 hypothetical protein SCDLUD_001916 [Saccharomycodes ludwigii]SSD60499.1 probable Mitochondrial GTP/GDP carrier protein 1 [Saccharomycodes ludwigii]